MAFFSLLVRFGSFSNAARELDITTRAASKRLAQMEARLGVQLLNRTTRRMGLTPEVEVYLEHARRILADIGDMERLVSNSVGAPKGLLRVNATLGFGRSHIASLISDFAKLYPEVQVQLQLTVNPPPLTEDAFDICIRQGDEAYGIWHLSSGQRTETVKVRGTLSTNDGETALNWALDGHGVVMRAEWDIAKYLDSGRLRQVLTNWQTPPADIHAVYPQRLTRGPPN